MPRAPRVAGSANAVGSIKIRMDFGIDSYRDVRLTRNLMTRNLFTILFLIACGAAACPRLSAQGTTTGPMSTPPPRDVMRIPTNATPEASAIPPDEIIKRFAAKEDVFARASRAFGYRKTIVVQEVGDDGKATGEVEVITAPFFGSDGHRYERVIEAP